MDQLLFDGVECVECMVVGGVWWCIWCDVVVCVVCGIGLQGSYDRVMTEVSHHAVIPWGRPT
jgi:hypothetical protein